MNAIHEVGTAQVPIPESQVDGIMAALREEASTGSWLDRWQHRQFEVVTTGVSAGGTLWYGLTQLDGIVFSAPTNRGAVFLVAICGALVCALWQRQSTLASAIGTEQRDDRP